MNRFLLLLIFGVFSSVLSTSPTSSPTVSFEPTSTPTLTPSLGPTPAPTAYPTSAPTAPPTAIPTSKPSTFYPSSMPSSQPSSVPTIVPTSQPTQPTANPTTSSPTQTYTGSPTYSYSPSGSPTPLPTGVPTGEPSSYPSVAPTYSTAPSSVPTNSPTVGTESPTAWYMQHSVTGTVRLDNPDSGYCQPLALNISLVFSKGFIPRASFFRIMTPGITSGPCVSAGKGPDIEELFIYNRSIASLQFIEGTWENYYMDSYIRVVWLKPQGIVADTPYHFLVDRVNNLTRSCLLNSTWGVEEYRYAGAFGRIGDLPLIDVPDRVYRECYQYTSKLEFFPKMQKFPMVIKITLGFAFKLYAGDRIFVYLPGFTTSGSYLSNIEDVVASPEAGATSLSSVSWSTYPPWSNEWHEGSFSSSPKYQDSYVVFELLERAAGPSSQTPILADRNGVFSITINKASFVSAFCGQYSNYSGFAFEVHGKLFNITKTSFLSADGIGFGCRDLNYCSGNGLCDYCNSRCQCFNGFGSDADRNIAVTNDFHPDCSSRTCPVGPAMRNIGRDIFGSSGVNRQMECSNNGVCNRNNGTCMCFQGFGGAACEQMLCPGKPTCSGRGVCLSQSFLPVRKDALPLTLSTTVRYNGATRPDAWDGNFGRACVCDSSWPVGLGVNETQQAEYFGAACELRRCPSGDNPATLNIDETNCTGKVMIPGGEAGLLGNKCHVDCSGQGLCDYKTGICRCFSGYTGVNCGIRSKP